MSFLLNLWRTPSFDQTVSMARHRGSRMRAAAAVAAILTLWLPVRANQICELVLNSCPESFQGDTIEVPESVVALTQNVFACKPRTTVEGPGASKPPSIMFVIDHSGSMSTANNPNDRMGARFRVVDSLLDTILAVQPNAEVGVVVFQDMLYFDKTSPDYFAQYFRTLPRTMDGNANQAYLGLLRLSGNYGGRTGLQVIRDVLKTQTATTREGVQYTDLVYKPSFPTPGRTNISLAMMAAKHGFTAAANPKERQFVIFLSDGEPNVPSSQTDSYPIRDTWQRGDSMPTTFTVYFTSQAQVPATIRTMTENIRVNNYSTTNPKSDYWAIQASFQTLKSVLVDKILGIVLTTQQSTPYTMTINGIGSASYVDSHFVFSERFPLQRTVSTFSMGIKYSKLNEATGEVRDTTVTTTFHVKRTASARVPNGVTVACVNRPTMDLYYQGNPVPVVNETMANLEVRFFPQGWTYDSVRTSVASSVETESFALNRNSNYWSVTFPRAIGTAVANDRTVQHQATDSFVVVYRNPKIPLDTLRIVRPFRISRSITVQSAAYFDRNADGRIDSIFVAVDGSVSEQDLATLRTWMAIAPSRGFTNVVYKAERNGVSILVESSGLSTSVTAGDTLSVRSGFLPNGGFVNASKVSIADRVAPVIDRATGKIGADVQDSLVVYFTEPIGPVTFATPFRFMSAEGKEYTSAFQFVSQRDDGGYRFVATGTQMLKVGDTIWIHTGSGIRDEQSNLQLNPANRRVPIVVTDVSFSLVYQVTNNPYVPGKSTLPGAISGVVNRSDGLVIRVQPDRTLRKELVLTGTASVYDVVKNPVAENIPMIFDQTTRRLYFVWDGRNSNGRMVATGTYLGVLEVSDGDGIKERQSIRIGVKR